MVKFLKRYPLAIWGGINFDHFNLFIMMEFDLEVFEND